MDNLSDKREIKPGEQPVIPESWKFPEKGKISPKDIVQIDPESRFLAFKLSDRPKKMNTSYDNYCEYFFAKDGKPRAWRKRNNFGHEYILFAYDSYKVEYRTGEELPDTSLGVMFVEPEQLEGYDLSIFATVYFPSNKNGEIERVTLTRNFSRDKDGKAILGPVVHVTRGLNKGLDTYDFTANSEYDEDDLKSEKQTKPNEITFRDKATEKMVFAVSWKVSDGILTISQTHLPTGLTKTLISPVAFDIKKLGDVVSSSAPYRKIRLAGQDVLDVPWVSIDRIVNCSLSVQPQVNTQEALSESKPKDPP